MLLGLLPIGDATEQPSLWGTRGGGESGSGTHVLEEGESSRTHERPGAICKNLYDKLKVKNIADYRALVCQAPRRPDDAGHAAPAYPAARTSATAGHCGEVTPSPGTAPVHRPRAFASGARCRAGHSASDRRARGSGTKPVTSVRASGTGHLAPSSGSHRQQNTLCGLLVSQGNTHTTWYRNGASANTGRDRSDGAGSPSSIRCNQS